jgi:hypothetical protein
MTRLQQQGLSAAVCEYAETPDRFSLIAPGTSVERFADERVCILQGTLWASVSGVSVAEEEVEPLVAEVRGRVGADKDLVWWVGPSARPPSLADRLRTLGLDDPRDRASLVHAVALVREPEAQPSIEVVRIETFEQFAAAREVGWAAFDPPPDRVERERERLQDDYEESRRTEVPAGFLALLDGRPGASALAVPSERGVFLIGGATAPWARGRGLYRALVRARWDYAVARGTPALVTHAVPDTSYPILLRLGFEDVCTIGRLEDLRGSSARAAASR